MTLVEFLNARIAEDDQLARAALAVAPAPWEHADRGWLARLYRADSDDPMFEVDQNNLREPSPGDLVRHLERHDPARVLAECEAKRRIITEHGDQHDCVSWESASAWPYVGCSVLRLLAAPFSDHPDFDPAWSPAEETR